MPAYSGTKHPVHLWTSPSERRAPFGPWGPPVGNAGALSTAGPHSRASRPQPAQDRQQLLFQEDKDWKVKQLLTGQSISGVVPQDPCETKYKTDCFDYQVKSKKSANINPLIVR